MQLGIQNVLEILRAGGSITKYYNHSTADVYDRVNHFRGTVRSGTVYDLEENNRIKGWHIGNGAFKYTIDKEGGFNS